MRLRFMDVLGLNKKTLTQDVLNNDLRLGQIKWYAPWRRYCFFPGEDMLFNSSCLEEISNQLTNLMLQRKEAKEYVTSN